MNEKLRNIVKPKYRFVKNKISYAKIVKAKIKHHKKVLELKALKMKFRMTKKKTKPIQINKKEIYIQDMDNAQKLIDTLAYPPNHDYDLKTLTPRGELKLRLEQVKTLDPNFFKGNKFLDIGCNKGFFSLLASQTTNSVCSIDYDATYTDLCNAIKQKDMTVVNTTFRNFITDDQFDKILFGNVHHYMFQECEGWGWIYKLAAISTGEVLFEGPIDMTSTDMQKIMPEHLKKEFTFEKFMGVMSKFFTLEIKIESILADRYVMLFKRKKDEFDTIYQLDQLPIEKILKDDYVSTVFLTLFNGKHMVAKIDKNPGTDLKNRINIARMSPISNGLVGSIYNGDKFIGWIEDYRDDEICKYKENQREIFNRICEHNVFLAKLGYFDRDIATINFFKTDFTIFDKGLVLPIESLYPAVYETFKDPQEGYYFIHLKNSFDIFGDKTLEKIRNALKSKDSFVIEKTYQELKNG